MDALLDTAPCYYFSFNDEGRLLHINQTLCDKLAYTKNELAAAHINQLLTLASRIFYQTHWFPMLKLQQTVSELYITLNSRDKTALPLLINSNRKMIDGEAVNECAGLLITNRQQYEDELIKAKKAYEAALSANTELSGYQQQLQEQATHLNAIIHRLSLQNTELKQINKVITHDLQEPIRKLIYYGEQLQHSIETKSTAGKNIHRLQLQSRKIQAIVSGLQQYIWVTELDTPAETVDLNQLIDRAGKEIAARYPQIKLNLQADTLPEISGNAEQLFAMVVHIFENAVRFRKVDKLPSLRVRAFILEQNSLAHLEDRYQYKNYLRITFVDDGIGFATDLRLQVFELFYAGKDSQGAGLGLALCKKVVDYHKGSITAESEPGKGTTITITLPL